MHGLEWLTATVGHTGCRMQVPAAWSPAKARAVGAWSAGFVLHFMLYGTYPEPVPEAASTWKPSAFMAQLACEVPSEQQTSLMSGVQTRVQQPMSLREQASSAQLPGLLHAPAAIK